jgi:hypothetical protein
MKLQVLGDKRSGRNRSMLVPVRVKEVSDTVIKLSKNILCSGREDTVDINQICWVLYITIFIFEKYNV